MSYYKRNAPWFVAAFILIFLIIMSIKKNTFCQQLDHQLSPESFYTKVRYFKSYFIEITVYLTLLEQVFKTCQGEYYTVLLNTY